MRMREAADQRQGKWRIEMDGWQDEIGRADENASCEYVGYCGSNRIKRGTTRAPLPSSRLDVTVGSSLPRARTRGLFV